MLNNYGMRIITKYCYNKHPSTSFCVHISLGYKMYNRCHQLTVSKRPKVRHQWLLDKECKT